MDLKARLSELDAAEATCRQVFRRMMDAAKRGTVEGYKAAVEDFTIQHEACATIARSIAEYVNEEKTCD